METRACRQISRQGGTALVEFAVTLPVFLIMVFAIMELGLLIMDVARANEVTRELTRIAIVHDPACDIFTAGSGCLLTCPSTATVTVALPTSCGTATDTTGCLMMNSARKHFPNIQADQIELTYACSDAGAATRPENLPLVTVGLRDIEHDFIFPDFLGVQSLISIPGFSATRIGEDMYTEK